VRITGDLDAAVLHRSLHEIVRRHEVLRTVYRAEQGQPVQLVVPELHVDLDVVDLRGLPELARETESQRIAIAEARRPFDLATGPILRAKLIRIAERTTY